MTNGEKFKEVFSITQVDECDLNAYAWLPNHDALDIPLEWWNAEYKETKTESVSIGVFEQAKWERDVAIQQLKVESGEGITASEAKKLGECFEEGFRKGMNNDRNKGKSKYF